MTAQAQSRNPAERIPPGTACIVWYKGSSIIFRRRTHSSSWTKINWMSHGLETSWATQFVWLNPPFHRYQVSAWVNRLAEMGVRHGSRVLVLQSGRPCLLQIGGVLLVNVVNGLSSGELTTHCRSPASSITAGAIRGDTCSPPWA